MKESKILKALSSVLLIILISILIISIFMLSIKESDCYDEEKYYQYCYDTVNNASMDDYAKLDFEYKSSYDNSYFNPFTDLELNF